MKQKNNKVKYSVGSVRPVGSMFVRFLRSMRSLMSMRSGVLVGSMCFLGCRRPGSSGKFRSSRRYRIWIIK